MPRQGKKSSGHRRGGGNSSKGSQQSPSESGSASPLKLDDEHDSPMRAAEEAAREASIYQEIEAHRRNTAATRSPNYVSQTDQDTVNSTRSLFDEELEYHTLHGRRYVGSYFMPIDEEELDRLRIIHQIYLHLFSSELTTVPLVSPTKILDIGTGSGDWAMEMGDLWPSAEIIGTDIAKIQPSAVPLNVFFEIDDAEEEGGWTWEEDTFDLVHFRDMSGAFSDWKHVYREAYMHLKPGGWMEVIDYDDNDAFLEIYGTSSVLAFTLQEVNEAAKKSGRPRGTEHMRKEMLEEIGFVDVHVEDFQIPYGIWPEEREERNIGKLWLVALLNSVEGYLLRLMVEQMGWGVERVNQVCEELQRELQSVAMDSERARGLEFHILVLVGRKPGGEDDDDDDDDEVGSEEGEADKESMVTATPTVMDE